MWAFPGEIRTNETYAKQGNVRRLPVEGRTMPFSWTKQRFKRSRELGFSEVSTCQIGRNSIPVKTLKSDNNS